MAAAAAPVQPFLEKDPSVVSPCTNGLLLGRHILRQLRHSKWGRTAALQDPAYVPPVALEEEDQTHGQTKWCHVLDPRGVVRTGIMLHFVSSKRIVVVCGLESLAILSKDGTLEVLYGGPLQLTPEALFALALVALLLADDGLVLHGVPDSIACAAAAAHVALVRTTEKGKRKRLATPLSHAAETSHLLETAYETRLSQSPFLARSSTQVLADFLEHLKVLKEVHALLLSADTTLRPLALQLLGFLDERVVAEEEEEEAAAAACPMSPP